MKNNKIIIVTIVIALSLGMTSCKKYIENAQINESELTDMPVNAILPGVETNLGYVIGGDYSRFACLISQQFTGAARQFAGHQVYNFTSDDFTTMWGNTYSKVLFNLVTIKNKAVDKKYNYYIGIADILTAYTVTTAVDMWGDVPYSEAFKGMANITPKYDKGQTIYDNVAMPLLDEAITALSSSAPGQLAPASDDIIYNGDVNKWIMFAHGLKARLYIHQTKVNTNARTLAAAELAQSFSSTADEAKVPFGSSETNANPNYQYNRDRADIDFASGFVFDSLMYPMNDPRVALFQENGYNDSQFDSPATPVYLLTYDELKFIDAEAKAAMLDTVGAITAVTDAVTANMTKLGVAQTDIDTFIMNNIINTGIPSFDLSKINEMIINQKYISLYMQPEVFTDWRRTGYPNIPLINSAIIPQIPRRFLYSQDEKSTNTNTPIATLLAPKIWWDQ